MRVAFDATPLLDARTGVGTFVAEVASRLAHVDDVDLIGYGLTRRYLDALAARLPEGVAPTERAIPARSNRALWKRVAWPPIERWTGPIDLVHGTNFVVPPARDAVQLVTVHDLTPVRFPELCDRNTVQYPRLIAAALRRGAHVHAVSHFVAEEVSSVFGLETDRVHVVANGFSPPAPGNADSGRRLAGATRYVLALGTIEPRKNLDVLVTAFDSIAAEDEGIALVIAGSRGWRLEAFDSAVRASRHADRIVCTGRVTDESRADLLAGATVLAYPSRYEGFGFPPLEAMSVGTPVIAARAGAIPEVVGDAALLVDPEVDALAGGLRQILGDATLRTELVRRGSIQTSAYSWERCVDELVMLYRELTARAS